MKNKIQKIIVYSIPGTLLIIGLVNNFVFAGDATGGAVNTAGLNNPIGVSSLSAIVSAILSVVVAVGTVLVTLAIIYAGFLFVTARGNTDDITKAKSIFMWTVVGAIVLLGAEALSRILVNTAKGLGVNI